MRRDRMSRSLTAVLAVWFALVAIDTGFLHSCPMHDGPSVPGATAEGTGEHAGHHTADLSGGNDQGSSCCTCIGDCGTTPTASAPQTGAVHAIIVAFRAEPGLADRVHVPVKPAHVLPFANGPPGSA